jgi:hypothetical protein
MNMRGLGTENVLYVRGRGHGCYTFAVDHFADETIAGLTLGTLTTAESLRVQRRIYNCPDCLKRLIATTMAQAIKDRYEPPHAIKARVEKVGSEPGDGHADGDRGVLVA